ncbi:MAG: NlpC/P60 family protein [Alphaproteobacteria bacterium]
MDRRIHAIRDDLCDISLKDQIKAESYARPDAYRVAVSELALSQHPLPDQPRSSTLVHGEKVSVFEIKQGWAWLQNHRDHYVGYAPVSALALEAESPDPTHYVKTGSCFLYHAQDIKSAVKFDLCFSALLVVLEQDGEWALCQLADGSKGYCQVFHLEKIGRWQLSPAALAMQLINMPYLWGGGSHKGYDCSQIIQQCYWACGVILPRDSDMQQQSGIEIKHAYNLDENDLVFWKGHIGIMVDTMHILHANARDMQVAIWPLKHATTRFKAQLDLDIIAMRRIDF